MVIISDEGLSNRKQSRDNDSKSDMPYQIKAELEKLLIKYDTKLIDHRSGMVPFADKAVSDYEENVMYLKKLLRLA